MTAQNTNSNDAAMAPIVITGCPRSGTQMMGRVFGSLSDDLCLITEHIDKSGEIPEDKSGVEDNRLWWECFTYQQWDATSGTPIVDMPIENEASVTALRHRYEDIADGRRIVIKNPSHILYPQLMRRVFPNAQFVYCIRNPWNVLQSMTKSGRHGFLLRGPRVDINKQSLLHNAAIGWHDAVQSFFDHQDDGWHVAQYEQIVQSPEQSLREMLAKLHLSDAPGHDKAITIPRPSQNDNYFYIKNAFASSRDQESITAELKAGCERFSYPMTPDSMPGGRLEHTWKTIRRKTLRSWNKLTAQSRAA